MYIRYLNNPVLFVTKLRSQIYHFAMMIEFENVNFNVAVHVFCRPWDGPRMMPRETPTAHESFEFIILGLKVFMFVLLFLLVLAGATAAMGSFLLLTAAVAKVSVIILNFNNKFDHILNPYSN